MLSRVAGPIPFVMLALGARACVRSGADAVLVNIPGPQQVSESFGMTALDIHAATPHPPGSKWSVTVASYAARVSVGVTGIERDKVDQMAAGIHDGLHALGGASVTPR